MSDQADRDAKWVWRSLALVALMLALVAAFVIAADVILLLFGGCLLALVLRGASDWLAHHVPLPEKLSLALVVLALLGICTLAGFWLGPQLAEQFVQMRRDLPDLIADSQKRLVALGVDQTMLDEAIKTNGKAVAEQGAAAITLSARSLFYVLVVFISGLYFAIEPQTYINGLVRLRAPSRRPRFREVLQHIGLVLHRFLVGRLVSMAAVGVTTGVGLALLDVPLAALLGTTAGLLTFVPYAGPIAAAVPIFLVTMTAGPGRLIWVLVFYTAVQSVEGFVITPLVQKKVVALPPVLTLTSELVLGILFGPLGVIVSVPLAAATIVVVRDFYVHDHLEKPQPLASTAPS